MGFLAVDLGVEGEAFDLGVLGVPFFKLVILCSGLTGAKLYSANIASYSSALILTGLSGTYDVIFFNWLQCFVGRWRYILYRLFHLLGSILRRLRCQSGRPLSARRSFWS